MTRRKAQYPDYQEKEDAFMQLVPPAVGATLCAVPGEVCRAHVQYTLWCKPEAPPVTGDGWAVRAD